jgi:hypothetical protein
MGLSMIASMYVQIHYSQYFHSKGSFYHVKFTASAGGAAAPANSSPIAASPTAADTGASTAASTAPSASAAAGSAKVTGQPSNGNGQGVSAFDRTFFLVFY